MTKRLLIGAGVLVVIAVAYWLISPLFIERRVSEGLPGERIDQAVTGYESGPPAPVGDATSPPVSQPPSGPETLAQGTFNGLLGHKAQGAAKLIKADGKYYVRFEDDFEVTNGPDLFVYLGKGGRYDPATQLAALKGNVGSQNYEIPASINAADYDEVWVWCRAFSVAFGKAELR